MRALLTPCHVRCISSSSFASSGRSAHLLTVAWVLPTRKISNYFLRAIEEAIDRSVPFCQLTTGKSMRQAISEKNDETE